MSMPKWKLLASSSPTNSTRGSSKLARTGCSRSKGLSGHGYEVRRRARVWLPAAAGTASARAAQSRGRARRTARPSIANAPYASLACEGAPRLAVLSARRGRRRAADAEVRDAPAGARLRDARARAGRPEVGARRPGAQAADAGVGAPRALRRAAG